MNKLNTMNDVFQEVRKLYSTRKTEHKSNPFVVEYCQKKISEINWSDICNDSVKYDSRKHAFYVMYILLKNNLYHGEYADTLYELLPVFNTLVDANSTLLPKIMCSNKIESLFVIKAVNSYSLRFIETKNKFLKQVIGQCLSNSPNEELWKHEFLSHNFIESFVEYENKINKPSDFNENVLFSQINYYKQKFNGIDDYNKIIYDCALAIADFYRELVKLYPEENLFTNSFYMTQPIIFTRRFPHWLANDFYFYTLNPTNIPKNKSKICIILKGLDNQSTRMKKEDHMTFDFSFVQNTDYVNLMLEYIVTNKNVGGLIFKSSSPMLIANYMQFFVELKKQAKYPNKNTKYFTNQEAILLREKINSKDINISTKNNEIGAIRRFLMWAKDSKKLQFDDLFFDYLSQYEEPNKNTAKTIPDEDLIKINEYLLEKSQTSDKFKLMHTIFHLALQTEFRINQICTLTTDCIKPTIKPNQFIVVSNTKISHGKKISSVISPLTYHLLMDIIEYTESAREECVVDSIKNYIFLFKPKKGKNISALSAQLFSNNMSDICKELGLSHSYTASNLRDTHMTKSLEHIMRNGKSDMEMTVLSKHKHLDTTKNHYIEMELEKMLESTYGITIGAELIETDSKIVDDIPEHLAGEENDVEDGCGKCSAETCIMTNALPCMACKHFITTTKHEVFFKKAIENVNRLIESTKNRHDKEDLVTIKELYVLYLKAIIKHKEGIIND